MSYKNIFFLNKDIDIGKLSALSGLDPKVKIAKINNITLPDELKELQAYVFDELHANGGICQTSFNSEDFRNLCICDTNNKDLIIGAVSKIYQSEKESLKIKFIISYVLLYLQFGFIGVTSVENNNDSYEFDCQSFCIEYLSIWDMTVNSLLDLPKNTVLIVHR